MNMLAKSNLRILLILVALLPSCKHGAGSDKGRFKGIDPITEVSVPAGQFDPAKFVKVAVVQWAPDTSAQINVSEAKANAYKQTNIDVLIAYIEEAAQNGATFVVLPEFAVVGYPDIPELSSEEDNFRSRSDIKPYVETVDGYTFTQFSAVAKRLGITIQTGFAEVDPVTDLYHNSIMVIGANGKLLASYRKQHLFQLEKNYLVPGKENVTFKTDFGLVGLIICSDVFDSDVMAKYKRSQVTAMSLSTSWAAENSGWGAFVAGARATKAYMIAANQAYFPDSGVINPDGTAQSHIRQSTGIAYGFLPRASR